MRKLQNTLYVTRPEAYLSLDGENIVVRGDDEIIGRLPLHNLENIVCFGYRGVSPALMGACAEKGIGLCFLSAHGRFLARVSWPVQGNVLLRTEQYRIADDMFRSMPIAKVILAGKIYNGRWLLEHFRRDHAMRMNTEMIEDSVQQMKTALHQID